MRVHVGERALTAWLVLDVSASMTFGTADRRKADVAEGVALAVGHVATRRGNRLGVVALGGGEPRVLRPRQGRLGLLGLLAELRAEPEADGAGRDVARARALGGPRRWPAARADRRGLATSAASGLGGPAAHAARPPRRAGGRDPRPARAGAPAGRRPVARRPGDRPAAAREHAAGAACASASRGGRGRARGGRRGAAPGRRRPRRAVDRKATGCATLAGHLRRGEAALRAGAPARPRCDPAAAQAEPDRSR